MDGGGRDMDAAISSGGPVVSVRFLHAIPNTGALLVCHDPDGTGPVGARVLSEGVQVMRAEFGARSAALRLPVLSSGVLTLQRALPGASDAGTDAGLDGDAGVADPCTESLREATIPLPITGQWVAPRAPLTAAQLAELNLLPTFAADVSAITLLGTGVALNASAVEQRVELARSAAASQGSAAANVAGDLERRALAAAFAPRALIQPDPLADQDGTFSLDVLHAITDVPPAASVPANSQVGAVRVCVTAGTLDQGALPRAPAPGVPFRIRSELGRAFLPSLEYEFRAYAQADFDARPQDCATTNLSPVARGTYNKFKGGHAYTLALVGAIAPSALCRADQASLVRASCNPLPADLAAHIEVLED
jgi:hypothetical protein